MRVWLAILEAVGEARAQVIGCQKAACWLLHVQHVCHIVPGMLVDVSGNISARLAAIQPYLEVAHLGVLPIDRGPARPTRVPGDWVGTEQNWYAPGPVATHSPGNDGIVGRRRAHAGVKLIVHDGAGVTRDGLRVGDVQEAGVYLEFAFRNTHEGKPQKFAQHTN